MHLHIVTNIQWSCFMFSYKTLHVLLQLATLQCDQMARLFFNIWPFTLMQTCPMAYKICQSGSKMFLNSTLTWWPFHLCTHSYYTDTFHIVLSLSLSLSLSHQHKPINISKILFLLTHTHVSKHSSVQWDQIVRFWEFYYPSNPNV